MSNIVVRPFSPSDLAAVVALYQTCFAEPPWFESFYHEELVAEFRELMAWPDTVFLVADDGGSIVGGAIGFDLSRKADIATLVGPSPDPHFYLSELFVNASRRRQGIAEALMAERFKIARHLGYREAVVRTSVQQGIIRRIYELLNFKLVTIQNVESMKRIEGSERSETDERVILRGKIPM